MFNPSRIVCKCPSGLLVSRFAGRCLSAALCSLAVLSFTSSFVAEIAAAEIKVAEIKHEGDVDFTKEILPMLRQNCLACHNQKDAESDLILETAEAILKGGSEGPSVVPGKPDESLMLIYSAHREEPIMPPADNDVQAKPLTPEQLGLLSLWIAQGAKAGDGNAKVVVMEKLPPGVNPVYALAISPDGQYVAAGRANQVFLYQVGSKKEIARLTDPKLIEMGIYQNPGVAHLDLVQSVAFSPDNRTIATGEYKTVKIWQKQDGVNVVKAIAVEQPARSVVAFQDGASLAVGLENGEIEIRETASGNVVKKLMGHTAAVTAVQVSADGKQLVSGSADKTVRIWDLEQAKQLADPLTMAWIVNAVCLVNNDQTLAVAGENNAIDCFEVKQLLENISTAEAPKEAPKPVKSLAGHGGAVLKLQLASADGMTLLSASQDGTVRFWNIAGGNQLRQVNHGEPIADVTLDATGKRLATIGASPAIKLWNAENGQMIAELKGELRSRLDSEEVGRVAAVRQRYVELAKNDVEEQKKRKTSEEENAKKAEEELKKAQEDLKAKEEAAKVAEKNKADADAELKTKQEEMAAAEKALVTADEQLKAAEKEVADKKAALQTATTAVTAANAAVTAAQQKQDALQKELDAKPDDAALKEQVTKATAETVAAQEAAKKAAELVETLKKEVATAEQNFNTKTTEKTQANQKVEAAKPVVAAADKKVKDLEGPLKTAVEQKNASDRAVKNGERSVERGKAAVAAADKRIPELEAVAATQEEVKKTADAQLLASQAVATEMQKPFTAIQFSNDGLLLASGQNNRLTSWDAETGQAIESVEFAAVAKLYAVGNGNYLAVGKENKEIAVIQPQVQWNLARVIGGYEQSEFSDRVTAMDFTSDGTKLATGGGEPSRGGELKIWDVNTGALVKDFPDAHSDTILGVSFSPDDQKIVTSSTDRFVKTFDVNTGAVIGTFEGHTHHVMGVGWSADSRLLASSGADKVIKVWDANTAEQKFTIDGFSKEVTSLHFVGIQNALIAGGGDGSVRLEDANSKRQIRRYAGYSDFVYCVDVSQDGKTFAAGGHDSVVRVWQEDGKVIAEFAQPVEEPAKTE